MTIQYSELIGSRAMGRNKGSFTASRTFLVYEDSSADAVLLIADAINNTEGVFFSDQHPDITGIFANNFNIKASNARANTWEVTWQYAQPKEDDEAGGVDDPFANDSNNTSLNIVPEPEEDGDTGSGGGGDDIGDEGTDEDEGTNPNARLFTGFSVNTGVALVDSWKSNVTIPSMGAQGGSSGYLITDGDTIHIGGKPITSPVPTATMGISVTFSGATFYFNDVQLKAGMRNIGSFYGFDAGTVLFTGMSVQRQQANSWDITYNFAWDAWMHMRQAPNRDTDGKVEYNTDDPPTLDIYLKQPFPDTTSFSFAP